MRSILMCLLSLSFLSYSTIASAYYYAYVPDLTSDSLFVINTETAVQVDAVPLVGRTRDVLLNNSATTVYVSTEGETTADNESFINYIDTRDLGYPKLLQVRYRDVGNVVQNASNIRGMVISQDDNTLYATHSTGVTIFNDMKGNSTWESVSTTYAGHSMLLVNDDKLLIVLGSEKDNIYANGISIVNTETREEIFQYSLSNGKNTNAMDYNPVTKTLYLAHRDVDEVESLRLSYDTDLISVSLSPIKIMEANTGSRPIDLVLRPGTDELYVAFSHYIESEDINGSEQGTGEGYIALLDANDITNVIKTIPLSIEETTFLPPGGVVHPVAISSTDRGNIIVLKKLWGDDDGMFISELNPYFTDRLRVDEINRLKINKDGNQGVSLYGNGKFVGSNCDDCPTGELPEVLRESPRSSLGYGTLLAFLLLIGIRRRYH